MDEHDQEEEAPSRRGPLIALAVVVVLVAGSVWLSSILGAVSRLQDCVMSGRTNCVTVQSSGQITPGK